MKLLTRSTLRRISKNRLNTLINFIGLTLSLITFLIIISWIRSEKNYDRFWPGSEQIYRVALNKIVKGNEVFTSAMNFYGAGTVLQNEIPGIEASTHLSKDIVTVYTQENSFQNVNMFYADSSFFKVFPRSLQTETPDRLFPDVHGVLVSRSLAQKLFGDADPLNRKFKLNEGWEFYICGVFEDFPPNSHMKIDLLLSWKTLRYYLRYFNNSTGRLEDGDLSAIREQDPYSRSSWSRNSWYTYIKLQKGSSPDKISENVPAAIKSCISHYTSEGSTINFVFQPITRIHLHSDLDGEMFLNGSYSQVNAFTIIGILILIISWFNFVNLSSSKFLKQTVSTGIRRAMGAKKVHIYGEHFSETLVIYLAAGFVSLLSVFLLLHNGLDIVGFNIPSFRFPFLSIVCLVLIITGSLIASVFPFLMVMRANPSFLLKDKTQTKQGGMSGRKAVVVFQFGVSVFLIIGTITIFRQVRFMQHQELGLNMDQVMVSYSPMTMNLRTDKQQKLQTFKEEIARIPGVIDFTTAASVPGRELENQSDNVRLADQEKTGISYWLANIDQNYFEFFSVKILAGNNFFNDPDYDTGDVILNRMASQKLGFNDPEKAINQFVLVNDRQYRVVGVTEDYHHHSLREPIRPVVFFKSLRWNKEVGYYCAKISPRNIGATIHSVKASWEKVYPNEPYIFSFLDDDFNAQYEADIQFGNIYMGFSILAILIASMGLFAMARFLAENRTKEIGIRKVNGAEIPEVLIMLNKDFIKWVSIAFAIAAPIAYYAMNKWLENFAYKTDLSWWIFALAGLLALGIALLTVSWQSWKAATRNPVEALRY
ncbi:MAG TPA: hypothetical protein DIW50_08675, partial [Prolixibacteraceae bacterium]|nr:hypothetical protein [Prolixibacteraceae bacterium]